MKKEHCNITAKLLTGLLVVTALITGTARADELVYQPNNPNFGGNPMNGGVLLGNAQAQDDFKDPDAPQRQTMSNLDRLISSLEARVLTDLLAEAQNGGGGVLVTDEYRVEVNQGGDGSTLIEVTDFLTNETTTIEVGGLTTN